MGAANTVYVSDTGNHQIRRIYYGNVYTQAGSTYGFADGTGTKAQFYNPIGLVMHGTTNLYIADSKNQRIRRNYGTTVTTLVGNGTSGLVNGAIATARLSYPRGVAVDSQGAIYVADSYNNVIRKVYAGTVLTFAGSPNGAKGFKDGLISTTALFNQPYGLTYANGKLFIADTNNHSIRVIALK